MQRNAAIYVVSVFLAVIAVTACQAAASVKLSEPVRVNSQDQAATVLVTASMLAPWATVSAALKPTFTMTGDAAVAEVLTTTESSQRQVSAFGASLGVGLPGTSTSFSNGQMSNTTQGSNTSIGVTTTSVSNNGMVTTLTTTTKTPGVAPAAPTGKSAGGQLPTGQRSREA
jgi:hypothetical protein